MKTKKNLIFSCVAVALLYSSFENLNAQWQGGNNQDTEQFTYSDSLTVIDDTTSFRASGVTELDIANTRYVDDLPNFAPKVFRLDFKRRDTISAPGSGTYSTSMTISPWSDASAGYVHQLTFNNGGIFYRTGTFNSNWDSWRRIIVENQSGNVGIGTTNPSEKLHVSGNIRATGTISANEMRVTVNGADFVFDDNYRLRSLEEIEQFINENKHLPEIASANEMIQDGVNMGEFQIQLLQKIEELTLYIIGLEKRLSEIETK